MSALREEAVAAHAVAVASAQGPEAALAMLETVAADPAMRTLELRALAARLLPVPPQTRTTRATLLEALRRPHLDRLTAEAKARAARGTGFV